MDPFMNRMLLLLIFSFSIFVGLTDLECCHGNSHPSVPSKWRSDAHQMVTWWEETVCSWAIFHFQVMSQMQNRYKTKISLIQICTLIPCERLWVLVSDWLHTVTCPCNITRNCLCSESSSVIQCNEKVCSVFFQGVGDTNVDMWQVVPPHRKVPGVFPTREESLSYRLSTLVSTTHGRKLYL